MNSMEPGTLVFVRHDLANGQALPGWGTVAWVEEDVAKVMMDPTIGRLAEWEQRVPLAQLQAPEEVPQQWAARVLGVTLSPAFLDMKKGRLRSGLLVQNSEGKWVKLTVPTKSCDDDEPFTVDRGSAVGTVYYQPGNDEFKPMRFEGVGIPPTDIEAEQDSAALHGATWGPLFHKTWPVAQKRIDQDMMEHPDDMPWKDTALAGLRQVTIPEGVSVIEMPAPVWLYDIDGEHCPLAARSVKLCNVADGHEEAIAAGVQKFLDGLPKPSVLAIYQPPTPWQDRATVGWFWRVVSMPGTTIKFADTSGD